MMPNRNHASPVRNRWAMGLASSLGALLMILALAAGAEAHKGSHRAETDTAAVGTDEAGEKAAAAGGEAAAERARGAERAAPAGAREPAPYRIPPLLDALLEHPHNKIVHFPIVLTLVAALLLLLGRRRPELESIGFWLVWAAALSSLAAYFSGQFQEEAFEGDPREWLVEAHEKWGIAVGLAQAAWVLSLLRRSVRRFAWIWGLVVVALIGVAAFLGGLVAHGE